MRCQKTGKRGQCLQPSIVGSKFCRKHTKESDRLRSYQLSDPELQESFLYHSENGLKSLRDEVFLLRALVEQRLNLAKNDAEKVAAFAVISPAINSLDKLVNSIVKLEQQTSQVLDKEAARKLAEGIVEILTQELQGVENRDSIVDQVASKIAELVAGASNS